MYHYINIIIFNFLYQRWLLLLQNTLQDSENSTTEKEDPSEKELSSDEKDNNSLTKETEKPTTITPLVFINYLFSFDK